MKLFKKVVSIKIMLAIILAPACKWEREQETEFHNYLQTMKGEKMKKYALICPNHKKVIGCYTEEKRCFLCENCKSKCDLSKETFEQALKHGAQVNNCTNHFPYPVYK